MWRSSGCSLMRFFFQILFFRLTGMPREAGNNALFSPAQPRLPATAPSIKRAALQECPSLLTRTKEPVISTGARVPLAL
jgi:hypothetical protein